MEEKLKTGTDLGLDWKQLAEVWELRNHESKFYSVNEVNGCIEIDPNHLLTTANVDYPKEKITQFNTFITNCKKLFKQLLLDANTTSETNQLLVPMKTVVRIEVKTLKNKKYRCPFSSEESNLVVQLFYVTTDKEVCFRKSQPMALAPRMILWLEAMYILKHITDNLNKNSESAIKYAWEVVHPLLSQQQQQIV